MRNKQKGFSLIELLIVVAIILIIAAIAIPNLLRSKMAANEASAVASLRTLNTSAVAFQTTYQLLPTALSNFGPSTTPSSTAADLIDSLLAGATTTTTAKSGYYFTWTGGGTASTYQITALPKDSSSGQRRFFTDQSGVMRQTTDGSAPTSGSGPIG
jgi:type IV pilus assembly protein PilA